MLVIRPYRVDPIVGEAMAEVYFELPDGGPAPSLLFNIAKYKKLAQAITAKDMEARQALWDIFFKPVNGFFETLSIQEQHEIYNFYAACERDIAQMDTLGFKAVASRASDMFYLLVARFRLSDKVVQYPKDTRIPIPDFTGVTLRVQDTEEMSFREEEYYLLTGISILCKILSPVWGAYIAASSVIWVSGSKSKIGASGQGEQKLDEMFCASMIEPVLEVVPFSDVTTKFKRYMERIVKSVQKRHADASGMSADTGVAIVAAVNGFSEERQHYMTWTALLVKKFTNIDLLQRNCNIMTYLNANIRETWSSFLKKMGEVTPVQVRIDPGRDSSNPQDDSSFLEFNARVSRVPIDIPVATKIAVQYKIQSLAALFQMPHALLNDMVGYYRRWPIKPTILNKALVASILGRHLGVHSILRYLDFDPYTVLFSITQFYLAMRGNEESYQLMHLMTADSKDVKKIAITAGTDRIIRTSLTTSVAYKECQRIYGVDGETYTIANSLNAIMAHITEYEHTYNTAPPLLQFLGVDNPPEKGSVVAYGDLVMNEICQIYVEQHKPKGE